MDRVRLANVSCALMVQYCTNDEELIIAARESFPDAENDVVALDNLATAISTESRTRYSDLQAGKIRDLGERMNVLESLKVLDRLYKSVYKLYLEMRNNWIERESGICKAS
jgi:hypothetical protein